MFFYNRPFTCFFLSQTFHVFFFNRPFTCFFGTDLSHIVFDGPFTFYFDRPFTFYFCDSPLIFCLFVFATDLSHVFDRPFFFFFFQQSFHIFFFFFFGNRPFTYLFFCCRPTRSLSSRVSSKGFKAPLARQGPGKLHIPGPFVVSFIIIRPHVIDGLGIVGSWPCYGEREALF